MHAFSTRDSRQEMAVAILAASVNFALCGHTTTAICFSSAAGLIALFNWEDKRK